MREILILEKPELSSLFVGAVDTKSDEILPLTKEEKEVISGINYNGNVHYLGEGVKLLKHNYLEDADFTEDMHQIDIKKGFIRCCMKAEELTTHNILDMLSLYRAKLGAEQNPGKRHSAYYIRWGKDYRKAE